MAAFKSSGATPMAVSTWDWVTLPEEQAEPDETAMPSRSKFISRVSAVREILRTVRSIKGVKDARIDLVQDRLEIPDHFYGDRDRMEHLAKTKMT